MTAALQSADLPVAIYLNQRLVFDVLASLEGGFTHVTSVTTSSGVTTSAERAGEAGLGITNVFAFLGLSLKGSIQTAKSGANDESRQEERTHTPSSLFARLRSELRAASLVVDPGEQLSSVAVGDFVEFQATLRRNPIVDFLDAVLASSRFASEIKRLDSLSSIRRNASQGQGSRPDKQLETQVSWLRNQLASPGTIDLVAELGNAVGKAVLSVKSEYFTDPSLNDIIDGEFKVLGKVTRVVADSSDEVINLLRKAEIGFVGPQLWEPFEEALRAEDLARFTNVGPIQAIIRGPAIQVIPLAIFA